MATCSCNATNRVKIRRGTHAYPHRSAEDASSPVEISDLTDAASDKKKVYIRTHNAPRYSGNGHEIWNWCSSGMDGTQEFTWNGSVTLLVLVLHTD